MTDKTFRTSDYGQVGFLFALGFSYERLEPAGSQVFFHFRPTPELLEAIGQYGSNAPVPCRDLFHGLRKAKALIRENAHGYRR